MSMRIQKEVARMVKEPPPGISVELTDNPRYLLFMMAGPSDTPYAGGVFNLELFIPAEYPMVPPKVRFLTKTYHPNIDKIGRICLDILKDQWSPAIQISKVMISIQALLSVPNVDDPLDQSVAEHWKHHQSDALKKAREYTAKYAK